MLAVAVGLVKGLGEAVAHQQGEVGILRAEGGVGIGVAVHRVDALHVLGHHVAIGVHAEGAHLVAILLGAIDQLRLVDHVGDVLEHAGGQFHPHADVHLVVQQLQPQLLALVGEPLRAGAAGGGDEIAAGDFVSLGGGQAIAPVGLGDVGHLGVEAELQLVPQTLVDVGEDAQVVLGAQVLAPGLEQVQVVGQGPALQGLGLGRGGGEALGGGPVGHVDGVHIVDEVHHFLGLDKVGEPAAELGGKVELAVGKGTRAAKAAHGMAHGAVDALLHLARHDGAAAVIDILTLVQGQDLQTGVQVGQLVGGEDTGLAAAQDDNIIIGAHVRELLLKSHLETRCAVWDECPQQHRLSIAQVPAKRKPRRQKRAAAPRFSKRRTAVLCRIAGNSAVFLKAGPTAPAGDGDLALSPGHPQHLAAVGALEISVLLVPADGTVQPQPAHGGVDETQKPVVLLPAAGQVPGQGTEQGRENQHHRQPVKGHKAGGGKEQIERQI